MAMLLLVGGITFLPALNNAFVWDDDFNLVDNTHFRGFTGSHLAWMFTTFHDGNYHPLCWVTFGLDYVLWSLDPFGFHLTHLILHLFNGLACYLLILKLLEAAGAGEKRTSDHVAWGALFGAMFFMVHPLRVETVAWLSTRGDLVCGLFYMTCLTAYINRAQAKVPAVRYRWYILSLVCFGLSLLSRAWGITLPVVLLILDWYPLGRFTRPMNRGAVLKLITEKIPYVLMAASAAVLAIMAKMASMQPLAEHGVVNRILQSFYGLAFYPLKTVLPVHLSPLYLFKHTNSFLTWPFIVSGVVVILVTLVLLAKARRWPWALAAWMAYGVIVSLQLGIVQSGPQITADRYSYLSCLPFAVLLAGGVYRWSAAIAADPAGQGRKLLQTLVLCAVIAVLSITSVYQNRIWRNKLTLWSHTIRVDPRNSVAYWNRGLILDALGEKQLAKADYTELIRLNPASSKAYNNRGNILQLEGKWVEARRDFDRAIELNGKSPEAHASRGVLNMLENRPDDAIVDFKMALSLASANWPKREKANEMLAQLQTSAMVPPDNGDDPPVVVESGRNDGP